MSVGDANLARSGARSRCYCCGARHATDRPSGWTECDWCGAWWRTGRLVEATEAAGAFLAALRPGPLPAIPYGGSDRPSGDWFMDAYTLRIAATSRGLWLSPDGDEPIGGHASEAPEGHLARFRDIAPLPVALVGLAREGDEAIEGFLSAHAPHFDRTVLVLDPSGAKAGEDERSHTSSNGVASGGDLAAWNVTRTRRPLDDDFGAQRNVGTKLALQGLDASRAWAFHLDMDETIEPATALALGHVAAWAERAGLRAIGLRRRNLVDGEPSDLWPDTQYRLIRGDVAFEGRVHERPDACANWPTTSMTLHGAIDHHLSAGRVRTRTRAYDAMGQDRERRADEDALLRPFAP